MDIPTDKEEPDCWRLRSGYYECWPSWDQHDIVSIGWDVGSLRAITEQNSSGQVKEEVDNRLDDEYNFAEEDGNHSRGNASGAIRTVAAVRPDRYFAPGDYVMVFGSQIHGEPIIHGVAKLQEYVGDKYDIEEDDSHAYQWEVEYLAKGPVLKHDLPERFDGGALNLFLRPTLWQFDDATPEDIHELADEISAIIEEGGRAEISPDYFEYDEGGIQRYIHHNYSEMGLGISDIKREQPMGDAGRADFYCETEDDEVLIIETKQNTAHPDAVNQLQNYLQAARAKEERSVAGLLLAPSFREDTVVRAQEAGIELQRFRPSLEFGPVSAD